MPIFQDDLGDGREILPIQKSKMSPPSMTPPWKRTIMRKDSEESIRTDLCEGPVPDTPEESKHTPSLGLDPSFNLYNGTSDRGEFMGRLKRGESPNWLPNYNFESLLRSQSAKTPPRKTSSNQTKSPPLLPSAEISNIVRPSSVDKQRSQAGLEIERPRSALHSGDFTDGPQHISGGLGQDIKNFGTGNLPWLATSPPRNFTPFQLDPRFPSVDRLEPDLRSRTRAPSLSSSLSSSFVLKAPTSPLVQSESNDDLEFSSHLNPIDISPGTPRTNSRCHTSQVSHSIRSNPSIPTSASFNKPLPSLRRDNSYPYQAHQPRKSVASNTVPHSTSSPQTPVFSRSRRPSFSDVSPLHASMVGSYEESILRGRMSTTPSKPLDFVAQIGVLGFGKCKSSLKCPAHVTLPFPAVFYDYESTNHGRRGKSEDGPSPYVGCIDLENGLPSPEKAKDNQKRRRNATLDRTHMDDFEPDPQNSGQVSERELRRAEKQKRRSTSPRAPPGGSYRIPEKGQLQIIIKNPNKTAVKLFLVPYDLKGMEPGTKTFIRQRSYSAGPIIDSALSSSSHLLAPTIDPLAERSTLRYLVHIHICSPTRGRYYLYKSIRVVFANRVPDGKEKLRNEITFPEPRFTTYKAVRDSNFGAAGAVLAAEKAFRRRSSGFPLGGNKNFDFGDDDGGSRGVVNPIPFQFPSRRVTMDMERNLGPLDLESGQSSKSSETLRPGTAFGEIAMGGMDVGAGMGSYDKLSEGDPGYGRNAYSSARVNSSGREGRQSPAEGLLATRLRELGVGLSIKMNGGDGGKAGPGRKDMNGGLI
ncbi:a8be4592-8a30-4bab-b7fd-352635a11da1 [Sclerotinia trifoliorum]|uniref:A8be4592-8a30-4bab-b7fd-352635a11da1 n=1 Tax=Sclerotinia trifoliorum TaxID=28548 RepID=A0A8H2ZLR3_9HELO|nr:a8be4592-8a30-4bab-b7fd-352635a11da1 [Sclerotinia trifoliorum]